LLRGSHEVIIYSIKTHIAALQMLQVVITASSSVTAADWGQRKVAIEMVKNETAGPETAELFEGKLPTEHPVWLHPQAVDNCVVARIGLGG